MTNFSNGLSFLYSLFINVAFLLTKKANSLKFATTYPMKQMRRRNLEATWKFANPASSSPELVTPRMEVSKITAQIIMAVARTENRAILKRCKDKCKCRGSLLSSQIQTRLISNKKKMWIAKVIETMQYIMYQLIVRLIIFENPEKTRLGTISDAFFTIKRVKII